MTKIISNWQGIVYYGIDEDKHDGRVIPGFTDENGRFPKKTKECYPYSYDPICHYLGSTKANGTMYHDRMEGWNPAKYNECFDKYCRKGRGFRCNETMQKFLRDYLDNQTVILTCIIEYCNACNGYAYYRFDYYQEPVDA